MPSATRSRGELLFSICGLLVGLVPFALLWLALLTPMEPCSHSSPGEVLFLLACIIWLVALLSSFLLLVARRRRADRWPPRAFILSLVFTLLGDLVLGLGVLLVLFLLSTRVAFGPDGFPFAQHLLLSLPGGLRPFFISPPSHPC